MAKILVIEDDIILREEFAEWLRYEDYEVDSAEDGFIGLESARQNLPDLIICDVTMPRLNGHEVLKELKANPKTAHIPFLFMTARAANDDIQEGLSLGANGYITKPFALMEFMKMIKTALKENT